MKQDLTLNGNNLSITNPLSTTPVDLSKYLQSLTFNSTTNILSVSNSNSVDLTPLKVIQDLSLTGNELSLSNSSAKINLASYMDNTDNQTLTYNPNTYNLSISGGNNVSLGSIIAFRAKKTVSVSATSLSDITFIPEAVPTSDEYNDGNAFNRATGEFTASCTGIYTFNVSYLADGTGGSRKLSIYYKSALYEDIAIEISAGALTTLSITMKVNTGEIVKLVINTGASTQTGTGSFCGYRVY
jgi:hypothetical protein